jgi:hypothetical protein
MTTRSEVDDSRDSDDNESNTAKLFKSEPMRQADTGNGENPKGADVDGDTAQPAGVRQARKTQRTIRPHSPWTPHRPTHTMTPSPSFRAAVSESTAMNS